MPSVCCVSASAWLSDNNLVMSYAIEITPRRKIIPDKQEVRLSVPTDVWYAAGGTWVELGNGVRPGVCQARVWGVVTPSSPQHGLSWVGLSSRGSPA